MIHAKLLSIAGLCLAVALVGCPRSKLPGGVAPNAQQASEFPGPPPWKPPANAAARLTLAGLPRVSDAHRGGFHLHAGLRVYYQGSAVRVPAGIGLDKYGDPVSPVHTHRDKGVIHIEYGEPREFTLGQLFVMWGVPLGKATVLVDGRPVAAPLQLVFQDRQQIVVLFGPPPDEPIAWPQAPAEDGTDVHASPEPSPSPEASPSAEPRVAATATPSMVP